MALRHQRSSAAGSYDSTAVARQWRRRPAATAYGALEKARRQRPDANRFTSSESGDGVTVMKMLGPANRGDWGVGLTCYWAFAHCPSSICRLVAQQQSRRTPSLAPLHALLRVQSALLGRCQKEEGRGEYAATPPPCRMGSCRNQQNSTFEGIVC